MKPEQIVREELLKEGKIVDDPKKAYEALDKVLKSLREADPLEHNLWGHSYLTGYKEAFDIALEGQKKLGDAYNKFQTAAGMILNKMKKDKIK